MARRKVKIEVQPEVLEQELVNEEVEVLKPESDVVSGEVDVSNDLCICGSGKLMSDCCVKKYTR